jgi:hypothetical protein
MVRRCQLGQRTQCIWNTVEADEANRASPLFVSESPLVIRLVAAALESLGGEDCSTDPYEAIRRGSNAGVLPCPSIGGPWERALWAIYYWPMNGLYDISPSLSPPLSHTQHANAGGAAHVPNGSACVIQCCQLTFEDCTGWPHVINVGDG